MSLSILGRLHGGRHGRHDESKKGKAGVQKLLPFYFGYCLIFIFENTPLFFTAIAAVIYGKTDVFNKPRSGGEDEIRQ